MLQALRRLLVLPVDWSAARTLVFLLQHPKVRNLALPGRGRGYYYLSSMRAGELERHNDLMGVPRCNALAWLGILQIIDGPLQYYTRHKPPTPPTAATSLALYPPSLAPYSAHHSPLSGNPFSAANRDLVAKWLKDGKPLFTRQKTLKSLLLRKERRAKSEFRRHYYQVWEPPGKSPLSRACSQTATSSMR